MKHSTRKRKPNAIIGPTDPAKRAALLSELDRARARPGPHARRLLRAVSRRLVCGGQSFQTVYGCFSVRQQGDAFTLAGLDGHQFRGRRSGEFTHWTHHQAGQATPGGHRPNF